MKLSEIEQMGLEEDDGAAGMDLDDSSLSAGSEPGSNRHSKLEDTQGHDGGMEGAVSGDGSTPGPPKKRTRDDKYAIPTMEEGRLLRESEGQLSRGNLLRLETEELLGEVRVDHGKKSVKAIEEWLHKLKNVLEALPHAVVTGKTLDLKGIRLANHVPNKHVTLNFRPPEADGFEVAGSFMLRSLVRPSLNIDLALRIPAECIVARDILNHRYFDKRALYAGHIANEALNKTGGVGKLVDKVEISYFKGDPRKPVVLLYPAIAPVKKEERGKIKAKGKPGFVVRLLPCCDRDVMSVSKLALDKNNVRTREVLMEEEGKSGGKAGQNLVSQLPATPHYNNAILEDMCMKEHLEALHAICGDSEAFRDAIILGKVWLGQHGMRTSHDSLGGYEWSMLLLYLTQNRRVNGRMTALSIFQVALKFIADSELSSKCPTLEIPQGDTVTAGGELSEQEEKAFKEAFSANLIDTSLGLNVLARVSASALEELEMTARVSVAVLQERPDSAFSHLFMTRSTIWRKCDAFVQIPLLRIPEPRKNSTGNSSSNLNAHEEEQKGLLDKPLWSYVADRVARLLKEGLGKRCFLVRPLCGAAGETAADFEGVPGPRGWHPTLFPYSRSTKSTPHLTIGLVVDPTFAGQLVDKGPPAEDAAAARRFRDFWGDKSELRRFKDGSIVEALVWTGKGAQRHRVVEQVARHILARHDPYRCAEGERDWEEQWETVHFRGNELLGLVAVSLSGEDEKKTLEDEAMTRAALNALNRLQERVKDTSGMPLRVEALQAASPLLRYTSLLPPLSHPLAISPACSGDVATPLPIAPLKMTGQVEPIEILVRLETSNKWPDELSAIRSTGTAFLIRLAQCLEKQYRLRSSVGKYFLDVLTAGFCFRLRLGGEKELACLTRQKGLEGEALSLKESVFLSAPHHSTMHGLHLQKPAFGLTVRAVTRWLEEHMMSGHLRFEAVELMVASLFSAEASLKPPSTALAGFFRFLLLLVDHDWAMAPLVVDPQGELTSADREAVEEAFTRSRDRDGGNAMYLVAPYSRDIAWSSSWTSPCPERPILGRLVALARASSNSLMEWLSGENGQRGDPDGWQGVFRMSAEERETFDARLIINKAVSSSCGKASLCGSGIFEERRVEGCAALQFKVHKNLLGVEAGSRDKSMPKNLIIGFDPIGDLVLELQRRFGELAVFFSSGPAGSTGNIGVIWRPAAFAPRSYNVKRSRYMTLIGQGDEAGGKVMAAANVLEILAEMRAMAGDMIDDIKVS